MYLSSRCVYYACLTVGNQMLSIGLYCMPRLQQLLINDGSYVDLREHVIEPDNAHARERESASLNQTMRVLGIARARRYARARDLDRELDRIVSTGRTADSRVQEAVAIIIESFPITEVYLTENSQPFSRKVIFF